MASREDGLCRLQPAAILHTEVSCMRWTILAACGAIAPARAGFGWGLTMMRLDSTLLSVLAFVGFVFALWLVTLP